MDIKKIIREELNESVKLPIEIGDTVYMGKFKNKKTVIKTIEWSEKGDLMINGKSALRVRIPKKAKKVVKESEFDWAERIKSTDEQGPSDWVGRTFGYSDKLKNSRRSAGYTEGPNDDNNETFTITGVDGNGNLTLTKHHTSYGDSHDIGTRSSTVIDNITNGNWVWV